MNQKMTPKQRAFVKEYVRTLNATEAAMNSYDCKDRKVARNIGSENLAKLGTPIRRLLSDRGLGEDQIAENIIEGTKAERPLVVNGKVFKYPDWSNRFRFTELVTKLTGMLPKDSVEITGKDGGEIVIKVKEDRELIEYQEGEISDEEE